jgi:hypothetical protein
MRHRPPKLVPLVLAGTVSLAACSAVGSENPAPAQTASGDRLSLAGICPKKIVVQTGWYPQVDRAAVYSLVGPQRKIDAAPVYDAPDLFEPLGNLLEEPVTAIWARYRFKRNHFAKYLG